MGRGDRRRATRPQRDELHPARPQGMAHRPRAHPRRRTHPRADQRTTHLGDAHGRDGHMEGTKDAVEPAALRIRATHPGQSRQHRHNPVRRHHQQRRHSGRTQNRVETQTHRVQPPAALETPGQTRPHIHRREMDRTTLGHHHRRRPARGTQHARTRGRRAGSRRGRAGNHRHPPHPTTRPTTRPNSTYCTASTPTTHTCPCGTRSRTRTRA